MPLAISRLNRPCNPPIMRAPESGRFLELPMYKLIALLLYIGLGFFALRLGKTRRIRTGASAATSTP